MNNNIIVILQIIIGLILSGAILMQSKGGGLGSAFGDSAAFSRTRRGAEKALFQATIILSILFIALSLINILI